MIQDTCATALYVLCSLSAVLCLPLGYALGKTLREHTVPVIIIETKVPVELALFLQSTMASM